nr:S41 family peptidase [uncultured Capnocytophaga sp.]
MKQLVLYILLAFSLLACEKDFQEKPVTGSNYTGKDVDLRIRDFIWKGLNQYYLWQPNVTNLQDNRFGSLYNANPETNNTYRTFLKSFDTPNNLFYSLLNQYQNIDRFSYITNDYTQLENQFKGITASTGIHYALFAESDYNDKVILVVRYVVPGSEAHQQGMQRGDIVLAINNQLLTKSNAKKLLRETSTITFLTYRFVNDEFKPTGKTITLQQTQTPENPVLIKKLITQGNHKVAYLMYNAFIADFDNALNNAFADFAKAGATDLVLDLRYNGGGSIDTAVALASMITGQFSGQIFAKEQWNTKMHPIVSRSRNVNNYFVERLKDGATINSLKLSKVYILTTGDTASASELVINGLKPYIQVIQIGGTTVGKNQGSVTVYDWTDNAGKVKNTQHKWAMQPIVLKITNAQDKGDYEKGITPDVFLQEKPTQYGVLGDPSEPFLAKALELITGKTNRSTARPAASVNDWKYTKISTSTTPYLGYNEMYK